MPCEDTERRCHLQTKERGLRKKKPCPAWASDSRLQRWAPVPDLACRPMALRAGMVSILSLGPELYWEPHIGNPGQWGWIHPSLQISEFSEAHKGKPLAFYTQPDSGPHRDWLRLSTSVLPGF